MTLEKSARSGHLNCMRQLLQYNQSIDWATEDIMSLIPKNGSVEMIILAREYGCPWTRRTTLLSAESGNIECLKYAVSNGCPWEPDVSSHYAEIGNIEMLKYCREEGCPFPEHITLYPCFTGQLETLKYLHEIGIPFVENILNTLALKGHLDCFIYALEKGAKLKEDTLKAAAFGDNISVLQYCIENQLGFTDINVVRNDFRLYSKLINEIDLDDSFWRSFTMFSKENSMISYEFPADQTFEELVRLKVFELNQIRKLCTDCLESRVAKDISRYIICPFI